MRFRDLKAFNLTLLAKQGWRIQQSPNSLIHRVLKAKYFMNSFMDAQVGKKILPIYGEVFWLPN